MNKKNDVDILGKQQYVVIKDMSAGNESVGEMWQETKIFDEDTTLKEVMAWAMGDDYKNKIASRKRITITKPDNFTEVR